MEIRIEMIEERVITKEEWVLFLGLKPNAFVCHLNGLR